MRRLCLIKISALENCKKCNKPLKEGAVFCPYCGEKAVNKQKKDRKIFSTGTIIASIIGVVMIIIVIITAATRHSFRNSISVEPRQEPELKQYIQSAPVQEQRETVITVDYYMVYDTYRDLKDPYLNLRSSPSPSGIILKKLKDGEIVEVRQKGLGPGSKWFKVYYRPSDIEGYGHSRYLKKVN